MDTKLTLSVDKKVIERAKKYAKAHQVSLSGMIENYLQILTQQPKPDFEPTPLIKSLSGVIDLKSDFDYKSGYADFLNEKYK